MKGYPDAFTINKITPYIKLLMPWMIKLISSAIN